MSIINLALQSVGMMRSESQNFEEQLKSCKSLSDIRALGDKFPSLKDEVLDSVKPAKILLCDLIKQLKLKDQPFATFAPASLKDMDELWENLHVIDSTLLTTDTTQKLITSREHIMEFLDSHCKATH